MKILTYTFALILLLIWGGNAYTQVNTFRKAYGSTYYNNANCVLQTDDGGFVVAGSSSEFWKTDPDLYLFKTDSLGNMLWSKKFGGTGIEQGFSLQITADKGFIICGYINGTGNGGYDVYLLRTDSAGNELWNKTFGGSDWDRAHSLTICADGGFLIAGETYSYGHGNADIYLIRTNALGDSLWTRTLGGTQEDVAHSVEKTSDGGFIVGGYTRSFGAGGSDLYLLKLDANGDTSWTKTFGGSKDDVANVVFQTSDNGYLLAGYAGSFGNGSKDNYYVRTNSSGDSLWTWNDLNTGSGDSQINDGMQLPDGKMVFTGYVTFEANVIGKGSLDMYMILLDQSGSWILSKTYGDARKDEGNSIRALAGGGFIIAGNTESFGDGLSNIFLVKTDSIGDAKPYVVGIFSHDRKEITEVFPNPFSNTAQIILPDDLAVTGLEIYELSGREVKAEWTKSSFSGRTAIRISREGLTAGMYFFRLISRETGGASLQGKLLITD